MAKRMCAGVKCLRATAPGTWLSNANANLHKLTDLARSHGEVRCDLLQA
jgi:hypothetical protein